MLYIVIREKTNMSDYKNIELQVNETLKESLAQRAIDIISPLYPVLTTKEFLHYALPLHVSDAPLGEYCVTKGGFQILQDKGHITNQGKGFFVDLSEIDLVILNLMGQIGIHDYQKTDVKGLQAVSFITSPEESKILGENLHTKAYQDRRNLKIHKIESLEGLPNVGSLEEIFPELEIFFEDLPTTLYA